MIYVVASTPELIYSLFITGCGFAPGTGG